MVETVSQSTFNFSSDYTPSYSFASTMRTCYANHKLSSINSVSTESSNNSSSNSPSLKTSPSNLESRRSSCNDVYLRNLDHNCNNKRCSNTITTTCVNDLSNNKTSNKPKLQLTTTTYEDNDNNLFNLVSTTQLSTPQSNGMISQKHQFSQFSFDNSSNHSGQQRTSTSSGVKQKRSESLGLFRQCSEINDNNNNHLTTNSFDDTNEISNSSEDDLVFGELSSSPSLHNHQSKNPRQFCNNTFVLCKRCGGSNSSLTSFSSISSSVSSTNNLNQYTLTNSSSQTPSLVNPQDNLINNLSHSLNQTFNFASTYSNTSINNLSTQFGRSRHNSINSLTLSNNSQQTDRNLHALHKALHNIFSN